MRDTLKNGQKVTHDMNSNKRQTLSYEVRLE